MLQQSLRAHCDNQVREKKDTLIRWFVWKTVRGWFVWEPKPRTVYHSSNLETMKGGSEVSPVWIPCPLPSLGPHKLGCCNSLPGGLAPAGVCLYIWVLTGGCKGCNICDLRCWECSLGGNKQPKYAYPLCCRAGRVDKDSAGRQAFKWEDVCASCCLYTLSHLARASEKFYKIIKRLNQVQPAAGGTLSNFAESVIALLGRTMLP